MCELNTNPSFIYILLRRKIKFDCRIWFYVVDRGGAEIQKVEDQSKIF